MSPNASQNILYTREVEDANYAEVDTKIVTDNSREELSINYKLHSVNDEWKVYDLVIEDISLVNNYRSQFDRVIARSSFQDLVRVMKEKQSKNSERVGPLNLYGSPRAAIHLREPHKNSFEKRSRLDSNPSLHSVP